MSNTSYISFREYKSDFSLYGLDEDLFLDTRKFGCFETEFEKWLKSQRLFLKRYPESLHVELNDVCLPLNKWEFFQLHYERAKQTEYLTNTYPDGFFETVGKDGEVACLLPDTYPNTKKPFRISFYRDNGPTYHEVFKTRFEALTYLANRGYTPKQGALDSLVGTDKWNRGLQVTRWIAEGIHPVDGLKRDKHIPEIAHLFPDC